MFNRSVTLFIIGKYMLCWITTLLVQVPEILVSFLLFVLLLLLAQQIYYQPCLHCDGLGPKINNIRTASLAGSIWITICSAWALGKGLILKKCDISLLSR